jgi:predicted phage-related endonuclease
MDYMKKKGEIIMARIFGNPVIVGEPEDWYRMEGQEITSRDSYGNPVVDMDIWAKARATANGHIPMSVVEDTGRIVGGCIGASDASVHSGIFKGHENGCRENTFNSKLFLYHKIREDQVVAEENDDGKEKIFAIGHDFEDAAAIRCLRVINEKLKTKHLRGWLVNDERMYQCGATDEDGNLKYPHLIADTDRIIYVYPVNVIPDLTSTEWVAENPPEAIFGYELKTTRMLTSKWEISEKNPLGVPENYQVQVHQYMGILGFDGYFIGCIPYYMDADPVVRYVPQDEAIERRVLENGEAFVQNAIRGIAPEPSADDPEKRLKAVALYESDKEGEFDATALAPYIEKIKELQDKKKALDSENRKNTSGIDAEIAKIISENLLPVFEKENAKTGIVGGEAVTLQHKMGRSPKTDIEALKKNNPELASAVLRETLLPMSKLKAAEKAALKEFQTPDIKPELELKIAKLK